MLVNGIGPIDWALLREQKRWLLDQDNQYAEGLVILLDHIGDLAVEQGFSEQEVFDEEILL
jgi:hypothetical protein